MCNFIISKSKGSGEDTVINFFGGEPLMAFDIIKDIVKTIEEKIQRIHFMITTNGTLLHRDICLYLVKKKFAVSISLDGDEIVHNLSRKYIVSAD